MNPSFMLSDYLGISLTLTWVGVWLGVTFYRWRKWRKRGWL